MRDPGAAGGNRAASLQKGAAGGRFALFKTEATVDGAALDGVNHFHLLRLVAALLVLFAHCFHLLDRAGDEPIGRWFRTVDASRLGVMMFFFISGFLVSRSWDARRKASSFLVARALRIGPALWLALFVVTFALGPVYTTLPVASYITDLQTWKYLLQNAVLRPQYLLPGVFEANPLPGVNGSLWTIPLEVTLYVILAIAGSVGLLDARGSGRRRADAFLAGRWIRVAAIGAALALVAKIVWTGPQYSVLAGYFVIGALAWRYRRMIALNVPLALSGVIATIALASLSSALWLLPLALPYALLVVALHPLLRTRPTWLHRHDYSYGAYLYGFPVQQALIAMDVRDPMLLLALSLPLTLVMAALSWHLVEHRALAQKTRLSTTIDALIYRR